MSRKKSSVGSGRNQSRVAPQTRCVSSLPIEDRLAALRRLHRKRCFVMEQRKRLEQSLGAYVRIALGWSWNSPDQDRKRIAREAARILRDPEQSEFELEVSLSEKSREIFETVERATLKEMSRIACSLPVWGTFGAPIRGFGPASLAMIVAEAGDLSNYSAPAKLWKRMGLAVIAGVRQGGLRKSASAEEWITHGYSRQRRSRMWNVGEALIKGNRDGPYRRVYLERKAYEAARDPEIPPMKAHRRAQRYMEKRLLRDLWRAWRREADRALSTTKRLPPPGARPQPAEMHP